MNESVPLHSIEHEFVLFQMEADKIRLGLNAIHTYFWN